MKPKSKRLTTLRWSRRKKVLASAILVGLMTSGWTSVVKAGCIWIPEVQKWLGGWMFLQPGHWYCPSVQINPTPQVINAGSNMEVEVGQPVNFNGSFTDGDNDGPYT